MGVVALTNGIWDTEVLQCAKIPFSFWFRCFPYPCLFLHFRIGILSRLMSPAFSQT